MKKNFRKNLKSTKGITLIALVITIIVLLILAGVSISAVFSQDGIFSRAEKSANKYNQAKARETLEILLNDAQIQKYEEGLTEEQLDRKIQEIGELLPKEDPNPNIQDVIVDGYIFKVDKSVPKIIGFVDKADGIIITAVLSNNATDGWLSAAESDVNIKGKIITFSGGKITTVSAKSGEIPISEFSINKDGLYEINHITDSSVITIEAEDNKGQKNSKEINVEVKIDKTAPTVETVNAEVEGRKIKLSATGHDKTPNGEEQSGIKEFNYTITPADGVDKASGTFSKNGTAEINVTNWTLYTIKVTATDKVGNTTETPKEQTVDLNDIMPPTISNATANATLMKITINATATDIGSGLKELRYNVSPTTITPSSGILTGNSVELTATELREYTITFTAVDNAENPATVIKKATTSDAMSVEDAKNKINSSNIREYMGTKVTYNSPEGGTWRIFYYDGVEGYFGRPNTVYLKRDFDGTKEVNPYSSWRNRKPSTEAVNYMKNMNPAWRDYPISEANTIDLDSERMAAGFYEQSNYGNYRNTTYSSYAIGSPSVEIYMKAFNIWKQKDNALVCKVENENGYAVGSNGNYINSGNYTDYNTIETGPNNIFMTINQSWWLSSPSQYNTSNRILWLSGKTSTSRVDHINLTDTTLSGCPVVPLDL